MEDKRIKKTKKYLKETLISLLNTYPFEKITVTHLCNSADISRITFYSHYDDKYDLVEDIFNDMIETGTSHYRELEAEFNQDNNIVTGFINVLKATLDLYYNHYDFFKHTSAEENPYLAFSFYNHVYATVEHHTNKESSRHKFNYTSKQITSFLCYGLLGFITESENDHITPDRIQADCERLLIDILQKGILFQI